MTVREQFTNYIFSLQDTICAALEEVDGKARFKEDLWDRAEGGGGKTRIIERGAVFEKGGVNTSAVYGLVNKPLREMLHVDECNFFACGLSLVLHPLNPYAPTVHANWRYFELDDDRGVRLDRWFGGGCDLTPYYVSEEDCIHFHNNYKQVLDGFGPDLYRRFKTQCDKYFVNTHRNHEMRGIGGIFYDYLRPDEVMDATRLVDFQMAVGNSFLDSYLPIVRKTKDIPYGAREVEWQEVRRGRYAEFNLIHDRGTLFGLKTHGRTESILMSLPPRARWNYDHTPEEGSPEADMLQYFKPRDWLRVGE